MSGSQNVPPPPARPVRSVLVLTKHRFLGDSIVAEPLLAAVRRAYPDARISLLTGAPAEVVLQNCPHLDRVYCYPHGSARRGMNGSLRLTGSILRLARTIRTRKGGGRPDICLVADRSFRSAVAALLCGGRIRAGFDSDGRRALLTHPVPYDMDRHEAECCLDILRAVAPELPGTAPYNPTPHLYLTTGERARGAEILTQLGGGGRGANADFGAFVAMQPGASHEDKRWPIERFAQVADALIGAGKRIVLVGGPEECEAANQMRDLLKTPSEHGATPALLNATGATTLRETMAILSHVPLFVGNDTGVNHLAAGVGAATIALFGPTPAHKWGHLGPRHIILNAPDGKIASIETDAVLAAARRLLGLPSVSFPAARRETNRPATAKPGLLSQVGAAATTAGEAQPR